MTVSSAALSCVSRWPRNRCAFCVRGHVCWTISSRSTRNRDRRSTAVARTLTSSASRDCSSGWRRSCSWGKEIYGSRTTVRSPDRLASRSRRNLQENVGNSSEFGKESRRPSIDNVVAHKGYQKNTSLLSQKRITAIDYEIFLRFIMSRSWETSIYKVN